MANTRELLQRRKGVQNTKKITKTMELISTAKLKKLSNLMIRSRPYSTELLALVKELLGSGVQLDLAQDPAKDPGKIKKIILLSFGSNRGLCGAYNVKIVEGSKTFLKEQKDQEREAAFYVVGKRTLNMFKYQHLPVDREFREWDDGTPFSEIKDLAGEFMEMFLSGNVDEIHVGYTAFRTRSRQEFAVERLLPLAPEKPGKGEHSAVSNFVFEPSPEAVLSELASLAVEINLYRMFIESLTSEQSYRMRAMKNASENADGMIKDLTRMYNRARQTQITMELLDIIGGAGAI